jgi:hypothetical protein
MAKSIPWILLRKKEAKKNKKRDDIRTKIGSVGRFTELISMFEAGGYFRTKRIVNIAKSRANNKLK